MTFQPILDIALLVCAIFHVAAAIYHDVFKDDPEKAMQCKIDAILILAIYLI